MSVDDRPLSPAQPDGDRRRLLGGKYLLGRVLGEGGMGSVYEAEHIGLNIKVAVKLLNEIFSTDPSSVSRFRREARAAAAIRHENIVSVTDTGTDEDGVPFIVMELVAGESLSALLRRERVLPTIEAVHIGCQLLSGLAAAHDKGVIHRDLKPGNILVHQLDSGMRVVKILDFGISKFFADTTQDVTQLGAVVGTPRFMAPEQASGHADLDARVDIYAVGVLLYRMLTGKLPFTGRTQDDVIEQTIAGRATPPTEVRPDLDPALERIVLRAMARDREHRFPDARSFISALRASAPDLPPSPRTVEDPFGTSTSAGAGPRPSSLLTRAARRGTLWLALLLLVAGLISGALYVVQRPHRGTVRSAAVDAGARTSGPPLRLGITRYLPSAQLHREQAPLTRYLSRALQRQVDLEIVDDFVDLADRLQHGELQLAVLSSCDYVRAKQRYPRLDLLATHVTTSGTSYRGYILARADSEIHRVEDLRGKVFCYTNTKSCSGYVYPRAFFRRHGMDPDRDFTHTRFVSDHLRALRALHERACDGAAIFADLLLDKRKHQLPPQDFSILAVTEAIPFDAYCASPELTSDLRDSVRRLLLALEPGSAAARRSLGDQSRITGFVAVDDAAYDPVRRERLDPAPPADTRPPGSQRKTR